MEVELWFRKYEMSHGEVKRQIYLATDEVKVIVCVQSMSGEASLKIT